MNVRYIAITDDVDTNKGINEEVIYKNFFNDLYLKDIVKKLKFSLKNKAKTKPLSCRKGLCFGYEEGEKGEWIIDDEEAEIVKRIFREYLVGTSMYKITKDLKNDKIMTASYRKHFKYGDMNNIKHRGPKPNPEYYYLWDVSTITYILRNKQYTGVVVNNIAGEKIILENHHQPIITKADFEKVQEKMKHNKAFGANSHNPMNNLVKCKCCDFAMVKNYYGKHSDVYQCIKCKMWIETSDVENIIKTEVEKRLESKKTTLTGNALAKEKHKILSKINRIENELTKLILEDANNNLIEGFNLKLKELRDNLTNLSTKSNIIFDLNGNQLTQEELKDYKKLAKILFKKVYFKKKIMKLNRSS